MIGIGPKTASALESVGVRRVVDLLLLLPRRYEDRGRVALVADAVRTGGTVLLHGRLSVDSARYVRRRLHIADGKLVDGSGSIPVRWFNQPWVAERLGDGVEAFAYGVIGSARTGRIQLVNPEIEIGPRSATVDKIVPVYSRIGPLAGKRLRKAVTHASSCLARVLDPLPRSIRKELSLESLGDSLGRLHHPAVPHGASEREPEVAALNSNSTPSHRRLAFDELLAVATVAAGQRMRRLDQTAGAIVPPPVFRERVDTLFPFELTAAQTGAVNEIVADLGRSVPMARLLQGDVGSGKTAVAIAAILATVEGGRQAALMAPTELLAEQLHRSVAARIEPFGYHTRLLTGSLPSAESRVIREGLADGGFDVVVGTHALFQDRISYADLGLVVIDEQHRFGVAQRQRLLDKGSSPHLLVMTATPIPRSLALTLYGDLDLTLIDELPPGRRPVRTEVRDPSARDRILSFLRSEIEGGGQAYIVCPVIDASSKIEAVSVAEYEAVLRARLGDHEIGVLHGRLGREEREVVMRRFGRGEIKALLATTVIEVGVDVPTASVMVVESADRFGLSQLHQLRGRVGRGRRRSWCVLVTGDRPTDHALRRLRVLEQTADGFEIAEADLRHRGPGELTGVRQWGAEGLRFADLVRHHDLVRQTRDVARRLGEQGDLEGVRRELLRYHQVGAVFTVG